ncbi:AraC family transcriptional regulator [Clostridium manihotivorum]|uniref:AraC family transcriptional regulator n=1 Tax=Clostridium manihotivorum TaxID=2320868 RepID=A0A410DZG3_9CLOT|nr:AraC family transcriptional regulator [Clostridium manihotivorum]QAA34479.1 AraC family transcriptional regulator [Clostridium manihotivorum]
MKELNSCKEAISNCMKDKSFAIAHLYQDEKSMDMHIHDCYEIYYSISGGKQFLINNKFYDISAGDLFVINQYESHYLCKTEQIKLERIVISVHPEFVKSLSSDKTDLDYCFSCRPKGFNHKITLTKEQQQRFMYYVSKITSVEAYGSDIIEKSSFMELLVMLNSIYQAQAAYKIKDTSYKYNELVEDILTYINSNICNEITIDSLSKQFFISNSYLCRIFKSTTGTTINKYITARRISIAKSLLASGSSVSDVCDKCGFNDYSNFLKSFTKTVGISPKKYSQYCFS